MLLKKFVMFAIVTASGVVWYTLDRREHTRILRSSSRQEIGITEVYDLYFSDSGLKRDVVVSAWLEISDYLSIPPGLIRPDDRLGKDIGGGLLLTSALDALSDRARVQLQQIYVGADQSQIEKILGKIVTVHDYVLTLGVTVAQA